MERIQGKGSAFMRLPTHRRFAALASPCQRSRDTASGSASYASPSRLAYDPARAGRETGRCGLRRRTCTSPQRRSVRWTAKRIFERLKKEHGFDGGYTIVKDYVRERRRVVREMFVPLEHPPGHAQCDFGQAWALIGGKKRRDSSLLRDVAASQRRHIHKGISRGDHGGVLRRSRVGVRLPGRSAAEHTLRQLEVGRGEDTGRRTSQAHEYVHGASVALPVQRQVRQSWQGQRQGECRGHGGIRQEELPGADPESGELRCAQPASLGE